MSETVTVIVVSDTSPIVNLAVIGQLHLLQRLYSRVIVPQAVLEEIDRGRHQPGLAEIAANAWIETRRVMDRTLVSSLEGEIDHGEAEAIALAMELGADLVLMDERKGRRVAFRLGLKPIGLMGILIEAKQKHLIGAVRPLLDDMIQRAGFWIGPELYDHILKTAGE